MQLSEDWKLIESNVHIQNSTYPEGFKLYMKRAGKGDFLEIEITDEKDVLPLVVIKEEPKISSEIYISRKPCWNDYYYGDTKKYREGVQIELSVQVSPNEPEKDMPMERMWTYKINGEEKKLDSLTFNIPNVIEPTELTFIFKIKSIDGKIETISKKTIIVEAP